MNFTDSGIIQTNLPQYVDSMNPQQCLKEIEKALTIGLSPTIRAFGRVV